MATADRVRVQVMRRIFILKGKLRLPHVLGLKTTKFSRSHWFQIVSEQSRCSRLGQTTNVDNMRKEVHQLLETRQHKAMLIT